jgi:DNA-binding HxlR family transcriptional regulator
MLSDRLEELCEVGIIDRESHDENSLRVVTGLIRSCVTIFRHGSHIATFVTRNLGIASSRRNKSRTIV